MTRSTNIEWLTQVQRADPDWRRDWLYQPELEPDGLPASRAGVKRAWRTSGPFDGTYPGNLIGDDFGEWTPTGATIEDGGIAPDGSATAFRLIEDETTGGHRAGLYNVDLSALLTLGETYTLSCFQKDAGRNELNLWHTSDPLTFGYYASVNALTQTAGLFAELDYESVIVPNSLFQRPMGSRWWWMGFSFVYTANTLIEIYLAEAVDGPYTYTGDGESGLLLWRPQIVPGLTAFF